jgi:hypothetical protein
MKHPGQPGDFINGKGWSRDEPGQPGELLTVPPKDVRFGATRNLRRRYSQTIERKGATRTLIDGKAGSRELGQPGNLLQSQAEGCENRGNSKIHPLARQKD